MIKNRVGDFAAFGGRPVFELPLIVGRPAIPNRAALLQRIEQVLDSGQLTNGGRMVREFEERLKQFMGVRHVIAVCNGTVALQIMAMACKLSGEVIVPSLTFIATAHALSWVGLTPVFADVDPSTHTLAPESVEACINSRTSAIMGVHLWGNPCHVASLQELADRCGLRLLFDASHAFGCTQHTVSIGNFGVAEAFSFHATKVMHSFEGGAVTTNDDEIAENCRLLRNFGITGLTQIDSLGTNGKMHELSAAAGLTSLESLPDVISRNRQNLSEYRSMLTSIPGLTVCEPPSDHATNAQYVVATIDSESFGLNRDQLLTVIRAEGVLARSYFCPGCHNSPPYQSFAIHTPVSLPVTTRLLGELIQFPTGVSIDEQNIRKIGEILTAAHEHARDLRRLCNSGMRHHFHPLDPARQEWIRKKEAA